MALIPMLLVEDVEVSSTWLCTVLPLTSTHGGPHFDMLADNSGEVVLWLHVIESDHEHPQFDGLDLSNVTGGAIYYLLAEDIEAVHELVVATGVRVLEEPHLNELAGFSEFTFEDPNGYRFTIHSAFPDRS